MPGKHRKRPKEPALEPVPSEILDHFVGQGPITAEELETDGPTLQEGRDRTRARRRADPSPGLSPGGVKPDDTTNHRNGTSEKTVLTDDGPLTIDVPRDRESSFEPRLVGKHERRFTGSTTRSSRSMRAA
jgi:hypothetical protein